MSYNRSSYSTPSGSHGYQRSSYASPSGNSRYSSTSSYDTSKYSGGGSGNSRYGSGLPSNYGGGSSLSSSNYSSRFSDYRSPSSRYGGGGDASISTYSPSRSSYTSSNPSTKYEGSSYTPRTDYSSRYSRPTSSYDTDYGSSSKPRFRDDYSSSSTKSRSSDLGSAAVSRPARKTRFADEDDYAPRSTKRSNDTERASTKTSRDDDSLTTKARQRKRDTVEEGSSPVPTRSADVSDVSSLNRKTESLNIDNSSQQSTPAPAGGPKPFVPSGGPAKTTQVPYGDGVATKGTSAMNQQAANPDKIPICAKCDTEIRGPFVLALNKSWCPNHFTCAKCDSELVNTGFVELNSKVYCENDYENFFAPKCAKCRQAIVGDTVNALEKTWHPTCFVCEECGDAISSGAFHVEEGRPYCMKDWQRLFQTKCNGCGYPVEPGDKWIEALDANWHSECFICGVCKTQLEGTPFYPKDGKPFCKEHVNA